jgi:S-adenosylmethionine:tRNA ribosyltransferase-isomerase
MTLSSLGASVCGGSANDTPTIERAGRLMSDYDFDLPAERAVLDLPPPRGEARLLVLERTTGKIRHQRFADLEDYLGGRSIYVNNSHLLPRWMSLWRKPGFQDLFYFCEQTGPRQWKAFGTTTEELPSSTYYTEQGIQVRVLPVLGDPHRFDVLFYGDVDIDKGGSYRLPPDWALTHEVASKPLAQSLYAHVTGSFEAPTAGIHLTREVLARLDVRELTLHTSPGTFYRVDEGTPAEHRMTAEYYRIPDPPTGKVVAVGTTTAKALEAWAQEGVAEVWSDLFIYPPYNFRVVEGLLTNLHRPRETLLLMTCAFGGYEAVMEAHRVAVKEHYRFSHCGDLLLII